MIQHWTFGQKIAAGFAIVIALSILAGTLSVYALRSVVASKDRILSVNTQLLLDAERLNGMRDEQLAAVRAFLLTGDQSYVQQMETAQREIGVIIARLRQNTGTAEGTQQVLELERAQAAYQQLIEPVLSLRRSAATLTAVVRAFQDPQLEAGRKQVSQAVQAFVDRETRRMEEAQAEGSRLASTAIALVVSAVAASVALAVLVSFVLSRALGRQIGAAVGHVQSSSAELQAAANQQATGAKEQTTAMSEITTTISELLATSRQIADSAQRVAQIAQLTVDTAKSGEGTVEEAHDSIVGIRRQMDQVVAHMLELGKKSQQIGAVLDIVSELAEQTNILSINATIEAAGAGEAGRRFGVVADEIRALADRVANSTKEIRALIEDVRGAVNTTVMATETGSKAVDAGTRQFAGVSSAFKQIAGQVASTTGATREIELSTKQQASAIEQVNVAISSVAQTTRETEISSGQTLQTVSQLASLSRDLLRLVQPQTLAATSS